MKCRSQIKSNQINSWFSAPPTTRTTTHYIVQLVRSLELVTVDSPEEECFQAALESWCGTYQLKFCWQPIPRLRSSDGECPLTEFQYSTTTAPQTWDSRLSTEHTGFQTLLKNIIVPDCILQLAPEIELRCSRTSGSGTVFLLNCEHRTLCWTCSEANWRRCFSTRKCQLCTFAALCNLALYKSK